LPLTETKEIAAEVVQSSSWIGYLPICVLPFSAVACCSALPPWVFMWILSFAIFMSLKWLTWWRARSRVAHSVRALGGVSSGLAGNGCRGFLGWESARTDATAHDLAVGDLRNGIWGDSALGSGTVRSAGRTPSARMGGNAGSDPAAALRHFPNR
jgi:hypothetical protein